MSRGLTADVTLGVHIVAEVVALLTGAEPS
jgi:hypothetical protein